MAGALVGNHKQDIAKHAELVREQLLTNLRHVV